MTTLAQGNLVLTDTKTGAYTAKFNELVLYDASAGPFQINAPASPEVGTAFGLKEVTNDTTAITISGNGNNIESPITPGYVASFAAVTGLLALSYRFDGTNWVIV